MDTAVGLYSAAGAAEVAGAAGLTGRLPRARPEPRLLLNVLGSGVGLGGVPGVLAVSAAGVAAPDGSGSDMLCICFETALTVAGSSLWFRERHAERASRAQRLP